jgi:RNA polymerase sigma-70 factor (ECF subfamily)
MNEHTTDVLAAGFAAHKGWAFGEAYQRHAALLHSAAYDVLGKADEAQDCVAETVARLWRTPGAYWSSRGSLQSFLVVCVRNEALSRRRRLARMFRLRQRLAAMPMPHAELRVADPIDRDRIRRALLALPVKQRIALELAYYEGKTQAEIAAELQEPLGTIKSRIKHGLRRLGTILESTAPDAAVTRDGAAKSSALLLEAYVPA